MSTTLKTSLKHILAWFALPFIAVLNGTIREMTYGDIISERSAHQVSSLLLIGWITLYTWLLSKKIKFQTVQSATLTGFMWLVLTVAFEFLFGNVVMKKPVSQLLLDYDLAAGRFWPLVLLAVFLLPIIFNITRRPGHHTTQ